MLPCIETSNTRNEWGYGRCKVRRFGRTIYFTHILAWIDAHQRLPQMGMEICHTCHNPACMQIAHLYEGTRAQNIADSKGAGRLSNQHAKKEACGKCGGPYRQTKTQRICPKCRSLREKAARQTASTS